MWNACPAPTGSVGLACQQLTAILPDRVFYPGNSTYVDMQESFWSFQESSLSPACIVVPSSPQDVAATVSILNNKNESVPFAIKGGGHSPNSGFANIQNGVTIDMTQIDSVSYESKTSVVSVGAGAKWLQVYSYLSDHGVAVAGGDNGGVGVGGLLIGGGMSRFSPRVGWACDSVVNVELVLASGEIVNANSTSNSDLWKALKGGTSNFGIVTRYDLATFEQGNIWGGDIGQEMSSLDDILQAFVDFADAPEYDPYATVETAIAFNGSAWSIVHEISYTKEVNGTPEVFQPLLAIEPQTLNTLKDTNIATIANETAPPPTNHILLSTATFGVDIDLLQSIFDINNSTVHELRPLITGVLKWTVVFQPLPAIWLQYGAKNGGNSLGTTSDDGNAIVFYVEAQWNETRASHLIQEAADKVIEHANCIAKEKGLKRDLVYLNYANANQNPLASYGRENLEHLRAVAEKYDPRGIFQTQVPGGFKVSKA